MLIEIDARSGTVVTAAGANSFSEIPSAARDPYYLQNGVISHGFIYKVGSLATLGTSEKAKCFLSTQIHSGAPSCGIDRPGHGA